MEKNIQLKFTTPRNFKYNKNLHAETFSEPSLTVPDESFTIAEILEQFTRGVDPMLSRIPVEQPEGDLDDDVFNPQDLTDIDEANEYIAEMNERIRQSKARVKELKQQENLKEEKKE